MSTEEQNATYRAQACYRESVEPIWQKIAGLTPDEYERRYLAAWERVYQKHPRYLYPDDRYREEFEAPRLEEVSELSYKNTVRDVQQARADTLQRLTAQADVALATTTDDTPRPILATLLRETAERISCFTLPPLTNSTESVAERGQRILATRPVFETLQAPRFTPVLPGWSGKPDCIVDEPERVGSILGQLEHFFNLREQFLAAELLRPADAERANNAPTPSAEQKGPDTLFTKLCGGLSPKILLEALGKNGLLLYDSDSGAETNTATSQQWAYLYWALLNKGYLPKMSNEKAVEILKAIKANTSKSQIGRYKPEGKFLPKEYTVIVDALEDAISQSSQIE